MPKKRQRVLPLSVSTGVTAVGFSISVGKQTYTLRYPRHIWTVLPPVQKHMLADSAAVFFTYHMLLDGSVPDVHYDFPVPYGLALLQAGLLQSLTSAVLEFPDAGFDAGKLLMAASNAGYHIRFNDYQPYKSKYDDHAPYHGTSVVPFSFGKDSLLTFALLDRFKVPFNPIFFEEPTSYYENKNKAALRKKFEQKHRIKIQVFKNTLGNFRDGGGQMWGWDLLLTQYTLLLTPFLYRLRSPYLFWSNERSVMSSVRLPHGFETNPNWEQSELWMSMMHTLFPAFGIQTRIMSVVSPLMELVELYILHHEFPDIGSYQLSCFNDTDKKENKRWCGDCHECARVFMFLLAVGIDPATVGFQDNMLYKKPKLFHLFTQPASVYRRDIVFQSYGERILSFYLAYRRGIRGGVMNVFIKDVLPKVRKAVPQLADASCSIYGSSVLPDPIKTKLLRFYRGQTKKFRKEITSDRLIPVGISV